MFSITVLLYLHRGFFTQAMTEHPSNPLLSPHRKSVVAAYQSACAVLGDTRTQFQKKPLLIGRVWRVWSFAFSAAVGHLYFDITPFTDWASIFQVVVGTVATRGTHLNLHPPALEQFQSACEVFRSAAEISTRAAKALVGVNNFCFDITNDLTISLFLKLCFRKLSKRKSLNAANPWSTWKKNSSIQNLRKVLDTVIQPNPYFRLRLMTNISTVLLLMRSLDLYTRIYYRTYRKNSFQMIVSLLLRITITHRALRMDVYLLPLLRQFHVSQIEVHFPICHKAGEAFSTKVTCILPAMAIVMDTKQAQRHILLMEKVVWFMTDGRRSWITMFSMKDQINRPPFVRCIFGQYQYQNHAHIWFQCIDSVLMDR